MKALRDMDAYYVIDVEQSDETVLVHHCDNDDCRWVSLDNAVAAAKAKKLKGFLNGYIVPCLISNNNHLQDYYYCNGSIYRWLSWRYEEVFPRATGSRFRAYVLKDFLIVVGSKRYLTAQLQYGFHGYFLLSVEIVSRDNYDLVIVQAIKNSSFSFITAICTEVYKVTASGIHLIRSIDFAKYDRILRKVDASIRSGNKQCLDVLLEKIQMLEIRDDGQHVWLEEQIIY